MQNRYAGDVGDFGKMGMLRCIERCGIRIGVNWYLVEDESHNRDGKLVGYIRDRKFAGLDEELRSALASMVAGGNRSIKEIENLGLLQSCIYYHEALKPVAGVVREHRRAWHEAGLKSVNGCDLVFLDPDNGLLPRSVREGSRKSVKHILPEEIMDYYSAGHSVVFYNHRTREQLSAYLKRFDKLFNEAEARGATVTGISFRRGTVRDYFFILQDVHRAKILKGIENLLQSEWKQHFEMIVKPDARLG